MFIYKKGELSKKEKTEVLVTLFDLEDNHSDFYVTRNYQRLFLKQNTDVLFDLIKKGENIIFNSKGILLTTGISDKANRVYLKILAENEKIIDGMIRILLWNFKKEELWIKVKKENPIINILKKHKFFFIASRGKEILLCKKLVRRNKYEHYKQNSSYNK